MQRASPAALLMVVCTGTAAWGQMLSDPTRPPSSVYLAPHAGAGRPQGGLVLESVLISPESRSAIISGEYIRLGQKIGDLRLVRVTETEVVLLEGGERRTLKLFPGVDKRPVGSRHEAEAR